MHIFLWIKEVILWISLGMRSIIRQLSTGLWGKSVENVEIGRFFLEKGKIVMEV